MRLTSSTSTNEVPVRLRAKDVKEMTNEELEAEIVRLQGISSNAAPSRRKRAAEKISSLRGLTRRSG